MQKEDVHDVGWCQNSRDSSEHATHPARDDERDIVITGSHGGGPYLADEHHK